VEERGTGNEAEKRPAGNGQKPDTQTMMVTIGDIIIAPRHRIDRGDLKVLAKPICDPGLLQFIGITKHKRVSP
jgi:hypothetical protein